MAQLDITDINFTQMQRLVVTFIPATSFPVDYVITLSWTDGTTVYEEEFAEVLEESVDTANFMVGRIETQFPQNVTLDFNINVYEADGVTLAASGAIFEQTLTVRKNNSLMIQQAIYDIIKNEDLIDIYDREVNVLDNYFIPNDASDGECLSASMPMVRVGRPTTISLNPIGDKAMSMEHEIELKISDIAHEKETNNVSHLYEIANDIIFALKRNENLGLQQVGIVDKSLEFEFDRTGDVSQGDKLNSISIFITVNQFRKV